MDLGQVEEERDELVAKGLVQLQNSVQESLPKPPVGLQANSFALISACSSGVGSTGGGAGYPLGKRVRLAVRTMLKRNVDDRVLCKR